MTKTNGANRSRDVMGDDVNYLRPDILETTNRILLDIDEILNPDPDKAWPDQDNPIAIAGYYFNKNTRTFHSHLVWGEDGWKSGKIEGRNLKTLKYEIQNVLKKEFAVELERLREDPELPKRTDAPYLQILADLCEIKQSDSRKEQPPAAQLDPSGRRFAALATSLLKSKLSRADLMQAYAHIALARDELLSGIMYQCLDDRKLLADVDRDRLSFLAVDVDLKSEGYQTKCQPWLWRNWEFEVGVSIAERIPQLKKTPDMQHRMRRTIWGCLQNRFYQEGLENEFKQWAKRKKADETGLGHAALVVPVFDFWDAGRGYGALWGVLVCSFANEEARALYLDSASQERLRELLLEAERVSDAYFEAGLSKFVGEEIRPPYDLIELFVQRLHWIQDWERVTVSEKGGADPLYCYRHEPAGNGIELRWERCKKGDRKRDGKGRCGSCRKAEGRRVFKWSDLSHESDRHPILSRALVKELHEQEESQYLNYDIEFEFPNIAVVPFENGGIKRHLRHEIARQHIAAIRALLPKVYTRRSALRSAVSAIMGRNMSHNIGSHVLARYAGKVGKDICRTGKDMADHRGDFLSYLQRRMDFLAEVATSDQSFWAQPLSLREQVNRLNYGEQQKRFIEPARCPIDEKCDHYLSPKPILAAAAAPLDELPPRPILLSWITGKESLLASVEYGAPKVECATNGNSPPEGCCLGYKASPPEHDPLFACPGGEVGAHALFIILENVIRNSARHGGQSDDTVRVFVHVEDDARDVESIAIELIDPRTRLTANGCLLSRSSYDGKAKEQNTELYRLQASSLRDDKGGRKKLYSLPHEINSILCDEPFLDDAGAPNPSYWGVREMQICAHFLRGSALSDLESVPPSGASMLEAAVHELGGNKWCLKYRFHLQRAKLLAAVVNDAGAYRELTNELRINGVVVRAKPTDENGWREIAETVRGYGLLVVEEGIQFPADGTPERVALPVRTFRMAGNELSALINTASHGATLGWMERLHECMVRKYQCERVFWETKRLYGVVVARENLVTRGGQNAPNTAEGSFFSVDANNITGEHAPVGPLPRSLNTWCKNGDWIAAAWVDHPKMLDMEVRHAGFALAAEKPGTGTTGRNWISVEGAFSDSVHTAVLNELSGAAGHELLAAALPRVVVLDERVQSERNREARTTLPLGRMWPLMGVWVPRHPNDPEANGTSPHACDLDTPKLEAIKRFLEQPARREDQYPVDFLVIHLTILERLKEEAEKSLPETLKDLKACTPAEGAEVIIVTGRGVPSMARKLDDEHLDTARFLPISALLESLVLRPSKLALMRVLWSAGRPRGNGNS